MKRRWISFIFFALPLIFVNADQNWQQRITQHDPVIWRSFLFDSQLKPKQGDVRVVDGPTTSHSLTLPKINRAASFDGNGDYLIIPDAENLRFSQNDDITIEAWVQLTANAANRYIIGKGRNGNKENQNWALRVMDVNGSARISFLFRSAAGADAPSEYHRWNSHAAIDSQGDWHHVAVSYTFGKPKSIRGYVDGKETGGKWDMGGATDRAPIVDDAPVWIGSAKNGSPGNTWHGALDEIAVYRKIIPPDALKKRVSFTFNPPTTSWTELDHEHVQVQAYSLKLNPGSWPFHLKTEPETFTVPAMALTHLPQRYTASGSRHARTSEYIRLAAIITLPKGTHDMVLRAPNLSRLSIDGEEVAQLRFNKANGSGHGKMRKLPDDLPYPRPRLGSRDTSFTITATGKPQQILLEALTGYNGLRFTHGDLLVAAKIEDAWQLLSPAATTAFTATEFERYDQDLRSQLTQLSDQRRQDIRKSLRTEWQARHDAARGYIHQLPPIEVPALPAQFTAHNAIDHFIAQKMNRPHASDGENGPSQAALNILDEQCFRCHGKKDKGDLKLNTREAALAAGESSRPAIVPGHPEKSELIARITSNAEDERMPPKGDGLSESEVAVIRSWIAEGAAWSERSQTVELPPPASTTTLLRRLYLDTIGILPTPEQIRRYQTDSSKTKTADLIDQLLAHPRHADHWVSYWQDVLAENPRLVKGKLNNTGPFRWWLHEALRDKVPMDQFVYDLASFDGSPHTGGVAGFGIASENDAPMAAKAHVIATAFLGTEMKCARCHDAPYHVSKQQDLFSLAAMLEQKAIKVPSTSSVPETFFERLGDRKPLVEVTLKPGTKVQPVWPFESATGASAIPAPPHSREVLAWEITRPENTRFAEVMVNRVWKRYFGQGFVEPANDWEGNEPSHPALLKYLAREFVAHGYQLDHLSRLILNSATYQRTARTHAEGNPTHRFFEAPLQRRLSAEQLVDSLFAATGVPMYAEELTFDVPGYHSAEVFPTMGRPTRAWHFISLASDRDRPSLTLPYAESIVSLMRTFGWRENRSEPITDRYSDPTVLQPGVLANGVFGVWMTRLSPYSDLTRLAIEAPSPEHLTDDLFLCLLSRPPTADERHAFVAQLTPGFADRVVDPDEPFTKALFVPPVREVSWENHLSASSNMFCAEIEKEAALGPPVTNRLQPDWRTRMEDAVWSLINSPEMQFIH